MKEILAHGSNYTCGRPRPVDYIVLHYTAGDGDTAENNARYYAGENRKASAHYFVDQREAVRSVREEDTAWHAGNFTMNSRSIGVELCSQKDATGEYFIPPETLHRGAQLVKELMQCYGVPVDRVIRHFDVTGKICPAPMVTDPSKWEEFLRSLEADKPSSWAEEACTWAVKQGIIKGDGHGSFRWQNPVTREELAVMLYRLHTK